MISKDYEVVGYLNSTQDNFDLKVTFENVVDSVVVRLTYISNGASKDFTGIAYDNETIEEAIDTAHIKLYKSLEKDLPKKEDSLGVLDGEVIGNVEPNKEEEVIQLEEVELPKKEYKEEPKDKEVKKEEVKKEEVHPLVASGKVRQDQIDSLKYITEELNIHTEEKFSAVLYNWAEFSGQFSINSKVALCMAEQSVIDDFIKFATLTIINHEGLTFEDLEKAGI